MSRMFHLMDWLRSGRAPIRRSVVNRIMYDVIYSLPAVARGGFFNHGFHPPATDMALAPGLAHSPLQAAYYDFALRLHPGPSPAPAALLDIGCGSGGGLLQAAACFPGASLAGIDPSGRGIRQARRRLRAITPAVDLRRGSADRLPFPDASFDRVVSVGVIGYVDRAALLAEIARVLRPGGIASLTGGALDTPLSWLRQRLEAAGRDVGLHALRFTETTANCFAAVEIDGPRHAAMIEKLPGIIRGYAREWAALPGSLRHQMYLDRRRLEFGMVFVKAG
jgi:SAM-dependent methyltransferase